MMECWFSRGQPVAKGASDAGGYELLLRCYINNRKK
jgi:hypothetical protein